MQSESSESSLTSLKTGVTLFGIAMRAILLLALLGIFPAPAHAGDTVPQSSDLLKLEKALTQTLEERANGILTAEQYQTFLIQFRPQLAKTVESLPPSPANAAAHARILDLLGDHAVATKGLRQASGTNPPDRTLALGQTHYEKADYAAAIAAANEVLKHDPLNQRALFLKHASMGRVTPDGPVQPKTGTTSPTQTPPEPQSARTGLTFTPPVTKTDPAAVPPLSSGAIESRSGNPAPLWPLAVPLGAGLIGYGVMKSRGTWSEQEAVDPGQGPTPDEIGLNRKRLKVAAVAVAIGFGTVYGLLPALELAAPAALSLLSRGGKSLQHIATSEAGAILPEEAPTLQRVTSLIIFRTEHAARHLEGTKLVASDVETAISSSIRVSMGTGKAAGNFLGRVKIQGHMVEYRAFVLNGGKTINVGTYYLVK